MKVYRLPLEVPLKEKDYIGTDWKAWERMEDEHKEKLKQHMINSGYTGTRTGEEYRVPMADGYARYMLAQGPRKQSILIHLPYGDAWDSPYARKVTVTEVIDTINACRAMQAACEKREDVYWDRVNTLVGQRRKVTETAVLYEPGTPKKFREADVLRVVTERVSTGKFQPAVKVLVKYTDTGTEEEIEVYRIFKAEENRENG